MRRRKRCQGPRGQRPRGAWEGAGKGRAEAAAPHPRRRLGSRPRLTGGRWHTPGEGRWPRLRLPPRAASPRGEGAENSPRLALPGLSGGWRLRIVPSREPERGGRVVKGTCGGEGAAGGRRGHRAGSTGWRRAALPFPTWGTAGGPEGRGSGNRMGGAGDSLSRGLRGPGDVRKVFRSRSPASPSGTFASQRPPPFKTWLPSPSSHWQSECQEEPHLVPASPGPLSGQLVSFFNSFQIMIF